MVIEKLNYNPAMPHCATKCLADKVNEVINQVNICSPNGIQLTGAYDSVEDFEAAFPDRAPAAGTACIVASDLYVSTGEAWVNAGSFQGPAGPKGDTGPAGAKGAKGDTGPQGPAGADGTITFEELTEEQRESLRGPQGEAGPQGIQGEAGPRGPQGAQGPAGEQGPRGYMGDPGPEGPEGPAGADGPQGEPGYTPYINSLGNWEINGVDTGVSASSVSIPKLDEEKRAALVSLMDSYFNNRDQTLYVGDVNRNQYSTAGYAFDGDGKLEHNCSSLAQLVWGGVAASTFIGKSATYNGEITKEFDWGYYFKFPMRVAAGLKNSSGKPYGYVQPEPGHTYGSYGNNSYYSEDGDSVYNQAYKTYMTAADMAVELSLMGFEIPLSEVMEGDLVFFETPRTDDNVYDGFEKSSFKRINHVAMVYNVDKENGTIMFFESSAAYASQMGKSGLTSTAGVNITRAAQLMTRIVMCARHPAAYGKGGNVPDTFTKI